MKTMTKTIRLMLVVALFGAVAFVEGQTGVVKFTEFKFFSTKGEFDWDKVVYGTQFEKDKLYELQVAVDFENPGAKPFNAEVKIYLNGKLIKTEPYKDLKESGGFNSGAAGDSGTAGKVAAGVYKAELLYQGKVVKTAEATVTGGADKRIWHLIVESREDIGETAAEFKADLKKAFEALGDTVVDSASKESVDLYFYLGKDDADDDNDGKTDDKDVGDGNGDGIVNEQDMADVIDLDKEIPDVMDDYPDKDKNAGIYIYLEKETGLAMVFVSDADSLKETGAGALAGNAIFMNASFAPRSATMAAATVAGQVAQTVVQPGFKLYVGNLSYDTQGPDLRQAFEQGGNKVIAVEVVMDRDTGRSRGFGFVTMATKEDAKRGLNLDGTMLQGRSIKVNEAQDKGSGGGGGRVPRSSLGAGGRGDR